jgi:hypothetical protein
MKMNQNSKMLNTKTGFGSTDTQRLEGLIVHLIIGG